MINIYIDADGCPVKNEVFRVARRYAIRVFVVTNSTIKLPEDKLFELVVVGSQFDAADNWIVERVNETDIVVTGDIPLAARCLEKLARVVSPKGRVFTEDSIGNAMANRELASHLREIGEISGGPAPFQKRDRSVFLQRLDDLIQAVLKEQRKAKEE